MKKIIVVTFVFALSLSLASCGPNLENSSFENKTLNHVDEALDRLKDYDEILQSYYEDYYPQYDDSYGIENDPSYIDNNTNVEVIYRYQLLNYHLTDNRDYLRQNDDVIQDVLSKIDDVYDFAYFYCDENLKEGVLCYEEKLETSLIFYLEADQLSIDYKIMNDDEMTQSVSMMFSLDNQNKLQLEYNSLEVLDPVLERFENVSFSFKEGYQEDTIIYATSKMMSSGIYISTHYDLQSMDYYYQISDHKTYEELYFYDHQNQSFYGIRHQDENTFDNFVYQEYVGNRLFVSFSDYFRYQVNLMEIPGWDQIRYNDVTKEYDLYNVDTNLSKDSNFKIHFEQGNGEYVNTFIDSPTSIEQFHLNTLNLSTTYSLEYFNDKQSYYESNIEDIRQRAGFYYISLEATLN